MEYGSLRTNGKAKSKGGTSNPPEQPQHIGAHSSGKRKKSTIPLKPFILTEEEKIALGMIAKSPKPMKRKLEPFRIQDYLPDPKSGSNKKNVLMPSGTIVASSKNEGVKRKLTLQSSVERTEPKKRFNPHPVKTLFRSQLQTGASKLSKIPTQSKSMEEGSSTTLWNISELEEELEKKGSLSKYKFKSPPASTITLPSPPTTNSKDPASLIDEMIAAEEEEFKKDQMMHEEKIAAEKQSFERRRAMHQKKVRKLENLFVAIKTNRGETKENDGRALNAVEVQSPRTTAAMKMFKSLQVDHPMRTPKRNEAQHTPGGDLSRIRLEVMKECWLLQDTPRP